MNPRKINFNPGPGALPLSVLEKARDQLVSYHNTGMSILEMSHRSKEFEEILDGAKRRLRSLLKISEQYDILFLQGGATHQFVMIPLNFASTDRPGAYIITGAWAKKAYKEAKILSRGVVAASTESEKFVRIPKEEEIRVPPNAAYLHITSNNTIFGTQYESFPQTSSVPLIADMSSDIMSREIDVNRFGLIYAGAQKNLGPAGVTVVIVRKDLIQRIDETISTPLRYQTHAAENSLYNTPPTFSIYMVDLYLEWLESYGGVSAMEHTNNNKAQIIYALLDRFPEFYRGTVDEDHRSRMNITFRLPSEELEALFLAESKKSGFVGLKGHRSVGGIRVSLYNAITRNETTKLAEFMKVFCEQHG